MRRLRLMLLIGLTVLAGLSPLAQPASTTAQEGGESGNLGAMLQLLPLLPLGGESQAMITYANLALQAESVGVAPDSDDWTRALMTIPVHSRAAQMNSDEWRDLFGFGLTDLDQTLEFSAPPTTVSVLHGRFDPEVLIAKWAETGYETREAGQAIYYAIADDFAVDLQSPVGRLAMASANYLAILGSDTIALAPSEALIVATLEASAGTGRSLADEINIASLATGVPNNLAGGTIVSGSALIQLGDPAGLISSSSEMPDPDEVATQIAGDIAAASEMPALTTVLVGMTAGGPVDGLASSLAPDEIPAAQAVAVAATASNAAAETAAEVIDARLQEPTGNVVWSEFFTGWTIDVVEGEPVVRVEFDMVSGRNPGILTQMLFRRDLSFLFWAP